MELKGKIIGVLPLQSGEGKNGTWQKQEYILETSDSKYPKKVCFAVWGDNIETFNITEGKELTASIDIESREFNGKWYTNVQAWKIGQQAVAQSDEAPSNETDVIEPDDLPF